VWNLLSWAQPIELVPMSGHQPSARGPALLDRQNRMHHHHTQKFSSSINVKGEFVVLCWRCHALLISVVIGLSC
jgi:hypothetical protein